MLHTKKYFLTLTLLLSGFANAFAQEKLGLDSLIQLIKKDNPELKVYDLQIKGEDAKIEGASAWMAPVVGVSSFMTPYNNFSRPGNQQDGSLMFMAEQKFPNRSKINSTKDFYASQVAITKEGKAADFNELRAIARSVYFETVILQKKLKFDQQNLEILKNLKKLSEIRYTYNKADLAQIYQMEAKIYQLQNKISDTHANITIGKIKLNTLMNRNAATTFELDTNLMDFANMDNVNQQEISKERSLSKQYDAQIKSLQLENKMIAADAKPELNLQVNHMITYNTTQSNQFSLLAGISIPFAPWASKSYQSKLKVNELETAALQQQKESFIVNNTGMITAQEEHLKHMKMEIEMYGQKIIPAFQKSYEVNLLNYQENKNDLSMVLNAWKDLNEAQLEALDLSNNYYQMLAEYGKNVER
ncbi:MAG: TolC family protein [Pelobium sp.]